MIFTKRKVWHTAVGVVADKYFDGIDSSVGRLVASFVDLMDELGVNAFRVVCREPSDSVAPLSLDQVLSEAVKPVSPSDDGSAVTLDFEGKHYQAIHPQMIAAIFAIVDTLIANEHKAFAKMEIFYEPGCVFGVRRKTSPKAVSS